MALSVRRITGGARAAEVRLAYLLVAPAAACIALVAFYPLLSDLWLSLHSKNLRFPARGEPFVGLQNYLTLTQDGRFWNALRNTSVIAGASVGAELILGMLAALVIHRAFRGRGMVRAALLVPWAMTTVVTARMWDWIFNANYGIFNALLLNLRLIDAYRAWTASADSAIWAVIGADVWKTMPFMALLLLAGLQMIPFELYEAARIDGAGGWLLFWRITLPLLRSSILVALLFRTLDAVRIFDLPFVLTGGGPGYATETLSIYAYRTLFTNLDFGYGATLSFGMFLVVMVVALFYVKVLGSGAARAV
jgi:multiple sugar transport system permease protein